MLTKDPAIDSKEDPRIQRTRKLLTQALSELMGEKSFQAITVGEITERATVNRVTFYAHFHDKFDLLEFSMRQLIRERIQAELGDAVTYSDGHLRRLISLVGRFLLDTQNHCPPPHGHMQPLMEKQIKGEVYALLLRWLQARPAPRGGATAEQTATVASWAIYGAAQQWSQQSQSVKIEDFVKQVLPLISANLQPFAASKSAKTKPALAGGSPSGFGASHLRLLARGI